ncbi:hypothetical protein Lal_00024347 [Lupinus albus]|uniref:Putative RNA recognition motif domain, PWI domain-containing protein n=1 Tax=Lupinus albus TaxID=3870 RepID=A0A6A5M3U8_LUPAL|nr:putative RNA recognition motif domain, PWI domain-containing protein [Lupinus albus]KAF1866340.1 hypothetical protein Lal_00024347 [Lupinus albus]
MESVDRDNDRIFKMNFSADGAAKLRDIVMEKLKEFMGDYTDETLVEYVIVLLRNGKRKAQARNELNVFLGDNTDSFVSWLWNYLDLNLDLYVQPKELKIEPPKKKLISEIQAGGDGFKHSSLQSEIVEPNKLSRSRRNKDWKGLVTVEAEQPPIQSSEIDNTQLEEKSRPKVNCGLRSSSPKSPTQRKRSRADDPHRTKRDAISEVTIAAPRRLLQFAMRDAVATSRPSNPGSSLEPSLKRLRSVVSAYSGDSSVVVHPQRVHPASRVPNPMATVIKAVAEAAEDVIKSKSSGCVFDRLGRGTGMNPSDDNSQLEDNYQNQELNQSMYLQRTDYAGQYAASMTTMEHETGFPSDSTSDNGGFDVVDVMGHRVTGASQFSSSGGNRNDDSLMVQYSVAKNARDSMHLKQNREREQPSAARNASSKIVNISVNVNTWKPPQYQEPREVAEFDDRKTSESVTRGPMSGLRLVKENSNTLKISNGNENPASGIPKKSYKAQLSTSGSNLAACPSEDADSRTIFVSNVHFAATKDGLSRHFNKFGEVLKVVIVTDAATGQPKGAAYVEFMQKDDADNALSLDGTSFMSRILKVAMKSAAPQEPAPTMPWPRIVRGSPFSSARFSRPSFPRGIPGAFRSRPPMKLGARSMQWRRDAQGIMSDNGSSLNTGTIAAPTARGLTYVRTESKPEDSLGTTKFNS